MSSDADAEDIVSETFLKAARSFSSFDPSRAKFGTWAIAIARNCMASHFRKVQPTAALEDAPQESYAVDGGQGAVEDQLLARNLLSCLDDDERLLVLMKYREDMRNVDIARELDMNASTVSTVLFRALSKMRKVVERGV